MKKYELWIMLFVWMVGFVLGRLSVKPIIKHKIVIQKVYSLPEGLTINKLCNTFLDGELEKEKAKIQVELENYKTGYKAGYGNQLIH